jgi:hypothetical protein
LLLKSLQTKTALADHGSARCLRCERYGAGDHHLRRSRQSRIDDRYTYDKNGQKSRIVTETSELWIALTYRIYSAPDSGL